MTMTGAMGFGLVLLKPIFLVSLVMVHYQNDWDGGNLSAGVYYVVLSGPCMEEARETLTIIH